MYREDLYQCMCRMIMSNLPFRIFVSTLSHCSTSLPPFQGHPWGVSIPMDRYQGDHRELLDKIVTITPPGLLEGGYLGVAFWMGGKGRGVVALHFWKDC